MTTVGIPQGLAYYYYYPLWKTFFEELGLDVITSADSNRQTVAMGIESAVDEVCFPIKVYYGHVRELCSKKPDYIFAPRMVSVEPRSYICPKFMGIPDMLRASIPNLPPLIDITVDLSKGDKKFKKDLYSLGKNMGSGKKEIKQAVEYGMAELKSCRKIAAQGYTMFEAIKIWEGESISLAENYDLRIAVLGHGYSLYDKVISMNLIGCLREMGCQVQLVEMFDRTCVERYASTMPKRVFWTLGRLMVGSSLYLDSEDRVDGIVYLACFGCGPDSLVGEIIERKMQKIPFMMITMDEHTGEAGLITRLEAFCDMLRRRRQMRIESKLSTYGKSGLST